MPGKPILLIGQFIDQSEESTPILQLFLGILNIFGILFGYWYAKIFLEYWCTRFIYKVRVFFLSLTMQKSNREWHDLSLNDDDTLYRQGLLGSAMATPTFTLQPIEPAPMPIPKNIHSTIMKICIKYKPKDLSEFRQAISDDTWILICVKLQERTISKLQNFIALACLEHVEEESQSMEVPLRMAGSHALGYCFFSDYLDELFDRNNIDTRTFLKDLFTVLNKKHFKKNTFRIWGVPDSGKSMILRAIANQYYANIQGVSGCASDFYFADMVRKSIILLEELWVIPTTVDDFKSLLSGYSFQVAVKHSNRRETIERTPVLVTGNHSSYGKGYLDSTDEDALQRRTYSYYFGAEFNCPVKLSDDVICYYLHYNYDKLVLDSSVE